MSASVLGVGLGLRMSPASPPVQHTARCAHLGYVLGHGPRALGRLVVGMGMHSQQAPRLGHETILMVSLCARRPAGLASRSSLAARLIAAARWRSRRRPACQRLRAGCFVTIQVHLMEAGTVRLRGARLELAADVYGEAGAPPVLPCSTAAARPATRGAAPGEGPRQPQAPSHLRSTSGGTARATGQPTATTA